MCKAIQDMRRESLEQGIEQERRRMILVMANLLRTTGISENEMIDRIADSTGISEEEAFFYVYGDADSQVKDTEEDK